MHQLCTNVDKEPTKDKLEKLSAGRQLKFSNESRNNRISESGSSTP